MKTPAFLSRLFRQRPAYENIVRRAAGMVDDFAIDRFAVALTRLPDPDDVLRRAGMQRHDLKRLEFDDEISSALETRREAAVASPWRLDGSGGNSGNAKWVEEEIRRVADAALSGFWQAVPYGYSVSEAVYARRDGRLGFSRVSVKPMQWFEPLRDGRLIMQRPGEGERIELDQSLKFALIRRNPTYTNPYGEALLSRLYWAWYFRHAGWRGWMQFVERFGDPFVVTRSQDPTALVGALLDMGLKNVIGVGADDQIDVMLQQGDGVFAALDDRLGMRIQKTILGQTLTSQVGSSGSYAAAKVHDNVRMDKKSSDLRLLTLGGQWMVEALWRANRFAGEPPRFVFNDAVVVDKERAERDASLVNAGVLELSEDYLLRAYDYQAGDIAVPGKKRQADPKADPKADEGDDEGDEADDEADADKLPTVRVRKQVELADKPRFTPSQRVIEALIADAMERAPGGPLKAEDLRGAIVGARDEADLAERLALLVDAQQPGFGEILARAAFTAHVLGYIHAEERS